MVCKTDRIWLYHNKRYLKQTESGYLITKGICKTNRIWLCHNNLYAEQRESGYGIVNGTHNRHDLVMSQ